MAVLEVVNGLSFGSFVHALIVKLPTELAVLNLLSKGIRPSSIKSVNSSHVGTFT